MLPVEHLAAFVAASVLIDLAPGPDNLFVLTQSALRGRLAGLMVTLGLCTGLIVHTAAVALGLAVIFATSAYAFTALKLVGAAYLLYLAVMALRASGSGAGALRASEASLARLYLRGIVMNVTNPKVAIFFLAFLPQFADPAAGALPLQIALLGGVFILTVVVVFGGLALLAGAIGAWFAGSARARVILNRIAAAVFVGLALRLAAATR